jgi:hypothetical protein
MRQLRWYAAILIILAAPVVARAQDATISGTITDTTGGVLPGVSIRAVNQDSGNSFEAVTDAKGAYVLPVRIGPYQIAATLAGFGTIMRTVEIQVGQTSVVNLRMAPSTVQESVTVTGEAPLIATTTSSVSGNIDPKQMSDLPVLGRNWMSLVLLAPGNRTNAQGATPVQDRHSGDVREFELNIDGQQVTSEFGVGNQPRYSKDSIAEFQFVSNRFDATQGRSSGVQVNAVTKSGSNMTSGSFVGNFRNSHWNQPDPVLHRVLPYSDQQYAWTFGGPIRKDKLHFFGNFDYERNPLTSIWNTPYPAFNITLNGKQTIKMEGLRLDYELSPKTHLMTKVSGMNLFQPFSAGTSSYPSAATKQTEASREVLGELTHVFGTRSVNVIKGGMSSYDLFSTNLTSWSHHWQAPDVTVGSPHITLRGFSITNSPSTYPRDRIQRVWSARDDFSTTFEGGGTHALKVGGELLDHRETTSKCDRCMGVVDASGGPIPDPATLQAMFPDPFNADTWNLAALSPLTTRYTVGVSSNHFIESYVLPKYAAWAQDDWKLSQRLTLNLGLRYDFVWNAFAQDTTLQPWMVPGRPQDKNNVQPRLGFAYSLNDRTVVRGGAGLYYADVTSPNVEWSKSPAIIAIMSATNDGRPDFAANPFNGPLPTFAQAEKTYCYNNNNAPGCLIRDLQEIVGPQPFENVAHSWQSSVGVQRQFGADMALESNYVFTGSRAEHRVQDNVNVSFNQATGMPNPISNRALLPYPNWGVVSMYRMNGRSNYNGLQTVFTKRLSHRWQASLNYTLSTLKDSDPQPLSGLTEVPFAVLPVIGSDYGPAVSDQRHRAVFNGIWDMGYGFQVSGIYFYGSGERYATTCGCGVISGLTGGTGSDRLRLDGTFTPRNGFVGLPIQRVDARLQRHFKLAGRMGADGIVEVFNAFNRVNYGGYVTNEKSLQYGQPNPSNNLSYAPRSLQLDFRFTF